MPSSPNRRTRWLVAALAVAASLPSTAAVAHVIPGGERDVVSGPTDTDEEARQIRARYRASHRDRPSDRPSDRPADRPSDRPSDRPADRPSDRPADRPSDRPTDRPSDEPERSDTFRVEDAGAVTLAWNSGHVRVLDVVTAEGWRAKTSQEHRKALRVVFSDGTTTHVFSARLTEDGLKTGVQTHQREVRFEEHQAAGAGRVVLAVHEGHVRIHRVAANDGWKHRVTEEGRNARVEFVHRDGTSVVVLRAEMVAPWTVEVTVREHQRETDRPAGDDGTDGRTTDGVERRDPSVAEGDRAAA